MSKFTFGKVSMAQLDTVHPLLKELALKAIEISTVDFGILPLGGKRSKTDQKKLFDQGYSKCDGTIKLSKHQDGTAIDCTPYIDGKYTWDDSQAFKDIYTAMLEAWLEMKNKEYTLQWGGLWSSFIDKPHYELHKI
jgi:peptidoglycan L-alanyl-D-glutamate endopeptidase CwlK